MHYTDITIMRTVLARLKLLLKFVHNSLRCAGEGEGEKVGGRPLLACGGTLHVDVYDSAQLLHSVEQKISLLHHRLQEEGERWDKLSTQHRLVHLLVLTW